MDIAAMSSAIAKGNTDSQVGIALTKKVMDMATQQGDTNAKMLRDMELSVNPNVGRNVDIRL
jgi:hypothetical protein